MIRTAVLSVLASLSFISVVSTSADSLAKDDRFDDAERALIAAHQYALETYRRNGDVYRALADLERANPAKLLDAPATVMGQTRATVLNDYGFFLSRTLERFSDATPILERVVEDYPDRAVAYLNLADAYWRSYLFNKEGSSRAGAIANYNKYVDLITTDGSVDRIVKRNFSEYHPPFVPAEHLQFVPKEGDNGFSGALIDENEIYLPLYYPGGGGPHLRVWDREKLVERYSLSFEHDDTFQDSISGIAVCNGKLFVSMSYRYESDSRPGLYVFDRRTYKELRRLTFGPYGLGRLFCVGGHLYTVRGDGEEFQEVETKSFQLSGPRLKFPFKGYGYRGFPNVEFLREFIIDQENQKFVGEYIGNDQRYLVTQLGDSERSHLLNIYDLKTGTEYKYMEIENQGRVLGFQSLSRTGQIVIVQRRQLGKTTALAVDLAQRSTRTLIQGQEVGPMVVYRQYLLFGIGRDLVVYNSESNNIIDVLKNVTGLDTSTSTNGVDFKRITNLRVDRDRLFIVAYSPYYSRALDLRPLQVSAKASTQTMEKAFHGIQQSPLARMILDPAPDRWEGPPTLPSFEVADTDYARAVAVSKDERYLALGYESGFVSIVDLATGKAVYTIRAHEHRTNSLGFSANGKILLTMSSVDGELAAWNAATGVALKKLAAGEGTTCGFDASAGGERFWVTANSDGLFIYDVYQDKETVIKSDLYVVLRSIAADPNSSRIVVGGSRGALALYQYTSNPGNRPMYLHPLAAVKPYQTGGWINCTAFSSDGRSIFSVSGSRVDKWSVPDLKRMHRYNSPIHGAAGAVFDKQRTKLLLWRFGGTLEGLDIKLRGDPNFQTIIVELDLRDGSAKGLSIPSPRNVVFAYVGQSDYIVVAGGNRAILLRRSAFRPIANVKK